MSYFVLIVGVVWLVSYVKSRRGFHLKRLMCEVTRSRYVADPRNPVAALEYGSALMQCQKYRSALNVFESVKQRFSNAGEVFPFLDVNMEFCKKPLPWSNVVKDYKAGSWWHNFLLVRFGGRRKVAISDDTGLAFNAMLRMRGRN